MKTRIPSAAVVLLLTGVAFVAADEKVAEPMVAAPHIVTAPQSEQAAKAELDQMMAKEAALRSFRRRRPGGYLPGESPNPGVLEPMSPIPMGRPGGDPGVLGGAVGPDRPTALPQGAANWPRYRDGISHAAKRYREPASAVVNKPANERSVAGKELQYHQEPARVEESTTPPPQRGRFQVAIVGFEVNRQTRDDGLENDGRGDEIFLHCAVHHLDRTGIHQELLRTAQMGDANRNGLLRLRAGTAGDNGGLRSGDNIGTRRLPADFPADGFREFRLPLLVFDGELAEDQGAVLIAPSAWEWDDWGLPPATGAEFRLGDFHSDPAAEENRAAQYEAGFANRTRREAIARRLATVLAERPSAGSAPSFMSGRGAYPGAIGDMGGNRPIGMTNPIGDWIWQPMSLGLNYYWADYVSRTEFDGARGVVSIRYVDEASLEGDYTIHLQVRRVE